jgi:hypothetical protein
MRNFEFKNFNVKIYPNFFDCKEKVIIPTQVHGSNFVEVISGNENPENCDALITSNKNFKLGVKTADCASVCVGDGQKIGIIHVGWRGLCNGLYEKVTNLFDKNNLEIYVGPFLHSFQIQKDYCYDAIIKKFGEKFIENSPKGMSFDFQGAIKSILPKNAIFDERDTKSDLTLPSNRRDKTEGRLLTVISFR